MQTMSRESILPIALVFSGVLIALLIAASVYLLCKLWIRPIGYGLFKRIPTNDRESLDCSSESPLSRCSANREQHSAHTNGEENLLLTRSDPSGSDVNSSSDRSLKSFSNTSVSINPKTVVSNGGRREEFGRSSNPGTGAGGGPELPQQLKHCACCVLKREAEKQRVTFSIKKVPTWPHSIAKFLSEVGDRNRDRADDRIKIMLEDDCDHNEGGNTECATSRSAQREHDRGRERSSQSQSSEQNAEENMAEMAQSQRKQRDSKSERGSDSEPMNACVDIWRLRSKFEHKTNDGTSSSTGGSFERQDTESMANASIELRDFANWQSASTETHPSTLRSFDNDYDMRALQRELEAQLGRLAGAAVERDDSGYRSIEQANDGGSFSNGSKSSSRSHTLNRLIPQTPDAAGTGVSVNVNVSMADDSGDKPVSFTTGVPERAMHNRSFRFSKTGLVRRRQFSAKRRHMRPVYETVNDNAPEVDSSATQLLTTAPLDSSATPLVHSDQATEASRCHRQSTPMTPATAPVLTPSSLFPNQSEKVKSAAFCVDRTTLALFYEFSRVDHDSNKPRRTSRNDRLIRSARSAFALFQNGTAWSSNSEASRRSTKSSFESDAHSLSGLPVGRHLQTTASADSAEDRDENDGDRSGRDVARTRNRMMHDLPTTFCYSVPSFAHQNLLVADSNSKNHGNTDGVTITSASDAPESSVATQLECREARPRAPSIREIPVIKLTTDEDDTSEL